ncbi:hypothetical protein, partial [uncultured Clostridium sp.]
GLTEQMNAAAGSMECELKIYSVDGVLTTKTFFINISKSIIRAASITSTTEYNALTDALNKVQGIDNKVDKVEVEEKFEEFGSQLETNVQQLNSKINEVAITGTTTEVLKTTTETYIQEKINDGTIPNMTIKNKSIDTEKTKFITKYENLFNKENIILGKFLGGQVGSVASEFENVSFFYYILPCKKGDVITVSATSFAYLEMDNDNRILVRAGKEDGSLSNVTIT